MTYTNPFIEGLKTELDSKIVHTENGAAAFETAGGEGKNLVDFNFAISAMRGWSDSDITSRFAKVYFENPTVAVKYWAFCADCRGGLGERRTSRVIFDWLVDNQIDTARKILKLIPLYGRWDSLTRLIDSKLHNEVVGIIAKQLKEDIENCRSGKAFSLLAKWCPSENTSSPKTRMLATKIRNALEITPKMYRKMLSELRAGLKIVERSMSSGNWSEINYNSVPSKANILYKDAFMKHDKFRRTDYLEKLVRGDSGVKINSSVAFPCDIVHSYLKDMHSMWYRRIGGYDETIEQMWKSLPNYVKDGGRNTIVVADTSGSMMTNIGNSKMTAWDVAQSFAIYLSEKLSGPFKDKYIMFSNSPFLVDLGNCNSLRDKLVLSSEYNECSNTNFYKTMKLILKTAVNNNLKKEDIPDIIVISDMHFDQGAYYDKPLMEEIRDEFASHGYELPRMVYWNVCGGTGRSTPIPLQSNPNGVILMSGYSTSLAEMALSGETSPYKAILSKLNSERYAPVDECLG